MRFGGFQKNSLIDFPGTIACVVFTPGCNFTCPYCHNPDLAAGSVTGTGSSTGSSSPGNSQGQDPYTETDIFSFLEKRKGLVQGVAITGGEPTLQKELIQFCERVRGMGYKIKLDSNGTRPKVLKTLMDQELVDYLAMDIKTDLAHYPLVMKNKEELASIKESIRLIMDRAPAYEFRTTCTRPFISREIMDEIGKLISGAEKYVLQKCSRNVDILDPEFLKDDTHFFTDDDMADLKSIISPYVKSVRLR